MKLCHHPLYFLVNFLHREEMHPYSPLVPLEICLGERGGILVNNSIIAPLPVSGIYQWDNLLSHTDAALSPDI